MKHGTRGLLSIVALLAGAAPATAADMPRYDHIVVIVEENHTTDEIIGTAPTITQLSKTYGFASNYFGIRHPSEPNYVAMIGGDTFGIRDDDAFYCKPGSKAFGCEKAGAADYVDHTVSGPSLATQLEAKGLTWKGYFEDIPEPLAFRWPSPQSPVAGKPDSLYAAKHNGFITFKSVQDDPKKAGKIVGFDVLERDIAAGALPAFALVVPNQCNDMHGLRGHDVPPDCIGKNSDGLIDRADRTLAHIVDAVLAGPQWKAPGNTAIVITFDENDDDRASPRPNGCCGSVAGDPDHPGGGWIPTIVIANHGPRGLVDPTPYNHYSLLRTVEDAFGVAEHLRHAGDDKAGVVSMTPLFATGGK